VGAYSFERRRWGRINTLCSHLKTCFKADIQTKLCKIKKQLRYFWKNVKEYSLGAHKPWGRINTH